MQKPIPADAHRRLEVLAGKWTGQEKVYPSPFSPQGGTATGRANNRIALDGFAVIQDYEHESGGGVAFRGHGIFRWDAMQNCYVLYWFDSFGMPPSEFRGQFQGDVLTMVSRSPQGFMRAMWEIKSRERYTYRMDVSPDGANWQPFMEATYVRQD